MSGSRGLIWKRAALLSATLLSCLILAEVGLRVVFPERPLVHPLASFHQGDISVGWTGIPKLAARFKMVDFDVRFRHDEKGFRVPAADKSAHRGGEVVAFLGDSFTWGYGVAEGRQFTDAVQDRLGSGFNVRNFGMNGFSTVQEWMVLRREMSNGLHPKAVVVMLFKNDFTDNVDSNPTRPRLRVDESNAPPVLLPVTELAGAQHEPWELFWKNLVLFRSESMKRWSYLYTIIACRLDLARMKREARRLDENSYSGGRLADGPTRAMRWTLERLRDTCRSEGAVMACAYVTSFEDVVRDEEGGARSVSRSICGDLGIPFLDLTPAFRNRGGEIPGRLFFEHDIHWNDEGNAVAGEELFQFLKPLLTKSSSSGSTH